MAGSAGIELLAFTSRIPAIHDFLSTTTRWSIEGLFLSVIHEAKIFKATNACPRSKLTPLREREISNLFQLPDPRLLLNHGILAAFSNPLLSIYQYLKAMRNATFLKNHGH